MRQYMNLGIKRQPDKEVQAFDPSTGSQREVDLCDLEANPRSAKLHRETLPQNNKWVRSHSLALQQ